MVAPFLVMGTTDARHYAEISDCILRFVPIRVTSHDLKRIHGTNERVSIENDMELIQFCMQLIRNSDAVQ